MNLDFTSWGFQLLIKMAVLKHIQEGNLHFNYIAVNVREITFTSFLLLIIINQFIVSAIYIKMLNCSSQKLFKNHKKFI